jgi:energy-coupling factor transporter ATP-binding protein EcfA2
MGVPDPEGIMTLQFQPATRAEAKARVAILGPTGAGKTWTALQWARVLAGDTGKVAVIDTENASASLYADDFPQFDSAPWWPPYDATKLAAEFKAAAQQYDVLVLDSLTHFWAGDGGVLDFVDRNTRGGNSFTAWKAGTPIWRGLLDALIFAPCHVIVTMRSKMDHVIVEGNNGRKTVEKMGMAPQARNDVEYEFTVVGELDQGHRLTITKSRCAALADQVAPPHQAATLAETLNAWLSSADQSAAQARPEPEPEPEPADPNAATDAQIQKMSIMFRERGIADRDAKLKYISDEVGRNVGSSKELTKAEASKVIESLQPADDVPPLPLDEPVGR